MVNNLAGFSVSIGFDQAEGSFFVFGEAAASERIAVVSQLELSGVNGHDATEEELVHGNVATSHSLEEHLAGLEIELRDTLAGTFCLPSRWSGCGGSTSGGTCG